MSGYPPNRLVSRFSTATARCRRSDRDPGRQLSEHGGSRVGAQPTAQPVPGQHESTIHLFAHALGRMMSCSIVDDPKIVEGGRPNQRVGPNHDHSQLGNARTGPRAVGTGVPPGGIAPGVRLAP